MTQNDDRANGHKMHEIPLFHRLDSYERNPCMYVIGLTGGIASGKSTAAEALRGMGLPVIDADAISRALTAPGGAAAPFILERFGTLDRKALGRLIFSDARARQALNDIVHPMVVRHMQAEMAMSAAEIVVLDVPLLYEAGLEGMTNEVWVMHVPREEQLRRVMARDGLGEADALARIQSQMSTEEKIRRADLAIDTGGTFAQTRAALEDALRTARLRAGLTSPSQAAAPARYRRSARHARQAALEAQAFTPTLPHTRPFEKPQDAWEDTSTLLEIPETRSFFARQSPLFWLISILLLLVVLVLAGIIGVRAWRDAEAVRAAARLQQQLAEEKARYRLEYRDLIETYAAQQSLDPALVAAVIYTESRFDPQAVSYLGARGLMQIMEDTGPWIAGHLSDTNNYTFDRMYEPESNIRYGTWYLGFLSRLFDGDAVKMLAGYHAGQNRVLGWLENPAYSTDGKNLEEIPLPDTDQYVERVLQAYEMYKKHHYPPESPPAGDTENPA